MSAAQLRAVEPAGQRVPPHSAEAEQSILGALLLDNGAWPVASGLTPRDFYRREHQLAFGALAAVIGADHPADVVTVFEQLQKDGAAEAVGGMVYLNALAQSVPGAANLSRYVAIVKERAALRAVIAIADEANSDAHGGTPAADIAADFSKRLARVAAAERAQPVRALDAHLIAGMRFKQRDPLLSPWLHSQDLCMVFAARGIGKTHFGLAVAFAVATGGTFAKWSAPRPAKVLYLDGELPGAVMQRRLLAHCPDSEPAPGFLRVFTPDLLPDGQAMPDLSTVAGQAVIDAMVEADTALVVVDNLSAWARTGRENEAESWHPVAEWILSLRRRGIAVILVHHAGKGGQQRGTSKKEDLLDVVIGLSRPADYDPQQGAVFECEFTKARNLTGADAESIELTLGGTDERATWVWRSVEAGTYDRVIALTKEGMKPGDIATELEVNKSTVSRHLRRAREVGDLPAERRVAP